VDRLWEDKRWKIVLAQKRTQCISMTARLCGVSREAAWKWWQRYCETGTVQSKASSGLISLTSQPNHPQCVNMYMAITKYGVTYAHVVAGASQHKTNFTNKKGQTAKNITGKEYQSVLKQTLLPGH
jgi:hypothetical protein